MLLVFTDRPETDRSKSWSPSKLLSPQKSFFYSFFQTLHDAIKNGNLESLNKLLKSIRVGDDEINSKDEVIIL